ncbi:MAG: hypothetical protein Q8T08_21270, partial [Ignavibacteria bacterium]|nr:hypothetical protein [Ignavibacteria bacterium]
MNSNDIYDLFNDSSFSSLLRGSTNNYKNYANSCCYQGLIALPISAVNVNYDREQDSVFIQDEKDSQLGELLLCRGDAYNISSMTDELFCAYINEVPKIEFGLPGNYKFDYLIMKVGKYPYYKKYYKFSSSMWGGFIHNDQYESISTSYKIRTPIIKVNKYSSIPNNSILDIAIKSVLQFSPFERFLRLYHQVELLFDWYFVQSIKGLNDDLVGLGKILNEFRGNELSLLLSIIKLKCHDVDSIVKIINIIQWDIPNPPNYFYQKSDEIFNKYSRESNPFNNRTDKFEEIFKNGGFSRDNLKNAGLTSPSYEESIMKITSYWLYRVRCSIAHNRLGEYIMMPEDEKFIVDFAEPLIKEILV